MAITTMDDLISSLPGERIWWYKRQLKVAPTGLGYQSLWTSPGFPGAGAVPGSAAGSAPTSATNGAIPFTNPGGGNLTYLSEAHMASTASTADIPVFILYDRLVHTDSLDGTVTTAQTVNSAAITRPDANGEGAECWLEIYTDVGNTTRTATITYTNSSGTGSRTGTTTLPTNTADATTMYPFTLQSGDTGVKSVQSLQLSGTTGAAGAFGITLLRRIAYFSPVFSAKRKRDLFDLGLPQIYDSACLSLMMLSSASTIAAQFGSLALIQG